MITKRTERACSGVFLAVGAAAVAWGMAAAAAPAAAAPSGECVTAEIASPFRLPDGALHPAGSLTLCDTRAFSPVAEMHVIRVNGRSAGVFLSRKQAAEAEAGGAPEIVFERDAAGHLDLVGYILTAEGRSTAFRLNGRDAAWVEEARSSPRPARAGTALVVALAADSR